MASIGSQIKICAEIGNFGIFAGSAPLAGNPVFDAADAYEVKIPEYLPIIRDIQRGEILPDETKINKLREVVVSGKELTPHFQSVIDYENWHPLSSNRFGGKDAITLIQEIGAQYASFHLGGSNIMYFTRKAAKKEGADFDLYDIEKYGDPRSFNMKFRGLFEGRLRFIRERYNGQLAFENVALMPEVVATNFVPDPVFISDMFSTYPDLFMLFDIAHASVTARRMGISFEEYAMALPLSRISEVHISHSPGDVDMHEAPTDDEYGKLDFILSKGARPSFITVEHWQDQQAILKAMLTLRKRLQQ